jgi:hypothetical protein
MLKLIKCLSRSNRLGSNLFLSQSFSLLSKENKDKDWYVSNTLVIDVDDDLDPHTTISKILAKPYLSPLQKNEK